VPSNAIAVPGRLDTTGTVANVRPRQEPVNAVFDSNATLGFWVYLMTDCLLFAGLFAAYAVLGREAAGGPTGKALFELPYVLKETACLLASSFTFGLATLAMQADRRAGVLGWLSVTLLLGLTFLGMELGEFSHLVAIGAGPDRSAFLSSFFTLVGTHGTHVLFGSVWMLVVMAQVARVGLNRTMRTRLMCLGLFWHFLDIVWIGVFSFVYLMGAL
jgi:cytochrome o ubiquinol oxidase subunit 3